MEKSLTYTCYFFGLRKRTLTMLPFSYYLDLSSRFWTPRIYSHVYSRTSHNPPSSSSSYSVQEAVSSCARLRRNRIKRTLAMPTSTYLWPEVRGKANISPSTAHISRTTAKHFPRKPKSIPNYIYTAYSDGKSEHVERFTLHEIYHAKYLFVSGGYMDSMSKLNTNYSMSKLTWTLPCIYFLHNCISSTIARRKRKKHVAFSFYLFDCAHRRRR